MPADGWRRTAAPSMRQELIEKSEAGRSRAFGQLAALDIDRLHAIARLMLRDPYLAEDAVQKTLIRCWRQLPSYGISRSSHLTESDLDSLRDPTVTLGEAAVARI